MIKVIIKRAYKGTPYDISIDYPDLLATNSLGTIIENVEKLIDTIAQKWPKIDQGETRGEKSKWKKDRSC